MDLLNEKINEDRIATYRARKLLLDDLLERTFKIIIESSNPDKIEE